MHNKNTCIELPSPSALFRFLLVVFALGTVTQIVAIRTGMKNEGSGWLFLTMWMPTVAALTTSHGARQMAWAAIKRLSILWLGAGLLIGWGPGLLKTAFLFIGRMGNWDSNHFEVASDGRSITAIHHLGVVLGAGPQSFGYFACNLLLSMTMGSAVTVLVGGLGEEIGWRAFLQPSLEARFGRFTGTCLVGLIWAYWHLPVNLSGYNDSQHPLLNALLLFPVGVVAMSFGLAWLMRQSKSVWPPALAHGANNTIGSGFLLIAQGWSTDTAAELFGLLLVGGFFVWRSSQRRGRVTEISRNNNDHLA